MEFVRTIGDDFGAQRTAPFPSITQSVSSVSGLLRTLNPAPAKNSPSTVRTCNFNKKRPLLIPTTPTTKTTTPANPQKSPQHGSNPHLQQNKTTSKRYPVNHPAPRPAAPKSLHSFSAVYELMDKDADDNASRGESLLADARGNYIDAPGKLVALLGVQDLIIVDTPDALLVTRRDHSQKVGELVKMLEKSGRDHLL